MFIGNRTTDGQTTAVATCLFVALTLLTTAVLAAQSSSQRDPCATGDPHQRIIACSQTILNAPANAKARVGALVNRGLAHEALDELALALADYQAALQIDGNSVPALRSRAALLYRRGQNDEALKDLTHAIATAPDDVASLRIRGAVLAETGETVRAIEDYSKVLDRNPNDLAAREGRGLALASTGDHARAVQDFNRILERQPRARRACRTGVQPVSAASIPSGDCRLGPVAVGRPRGVIPRLLPGRRKGLERRRVRAGRHGQCPPAETGSGGRGSGGMRYSARIALTDLAGNKISMHATP